MTDWSKKDEWKKWWPQTNAEYVESLNTLGTLLNEAHRARQEMDGLAPTDESTGMLRAMKCRMDALEDALLESYKQHLFLQDSFCESAGLALTIAKDVELLQKGRLRIRRGSNDE